MYHSFKQYKNSPITSKTEVMEWNEIDNMPVFLTPSLTDDYAKKVVTMVWRRYYDFTDSELVSLTHKTGSPWYWKYREGENVIIPDSLIKLYYQKVVNSAREMYGKSK